MKILKFNESLCYPNAIYKNISCDDLDTFSSEEMNRILVCSNDGQGDTNCYTYDDIRNNISDSDIKIDGVWVNGSDVIDKMKRSEIFDEFCFDLIPNMTKYIGYDEIDFETWPPVSSGLKLFF